MPETRNTKRPNILLIFSDEHEAGVSGFAGDCHVRTQALDGLADNSVRFTSAVCASPLCTPSRMCLLTGKDVHNCAAWNNHWIIFPEHVTWPAHFSNHGYRTCLVGKMHLGGRDQMAGFQVRPYGDLRHGLGHQPEPLEMFPGYGGLDSAGDTEIPESLISDVVATREALAFLREHDDREPDMPWFLCLGYTRPHAPFTAPGRYIRRYRDILPPLDPPSRFRDELEPYARWNYDRYGMENLSAEMSQRTIEAYYAVVDFMDDCIGELLNGLRRDGILENTIVIYSTDHGDMLGAHGLWHKAVYYEQAISVPLLFSGPGIAPGSHIVDHPVSLIDLFPTCCALAGLPVPEGLDGVDMSPVLSDPDHGKPPRSSAASAYYRYGYRVNQPHLQWNIGDPYGAVRIIRERRWKYVDIEGGGAPPLRSRERPGGGN